MKLNTEQRNKIREERGIFCNEACDRCGKMLNEVRWTRRGESGEWCSRECRDGKAEVDTREARRIARAGRPRIHSDGASRQREYRKRSKALRNTPKSYV